jgi:hypothetical protein
MLAAGELVQQVHPQALRSAIMGMIEGMLRDQLLARPAHFPASYTDADMRTIFNVFLASFQKK